MPGDGRCRLQAMANNREELQGFESRSLIAELRGDHLKAWWVIFQAKCDLFDRRFGWSNI
jgi:hypothetical protein